MARRGSLILVCLGATIAVLSVPSAAGAAPDRFYGASAAAYPTAGELQRASQGGARTIRFHFAWGLVEGTPGVRSWGLMDQVVGDAARADIRVLPMLFGTPPWVSSNPNAPPIHSPEARSSWSSFIGEAARRYGPGGTFWAQNPQLPVIPIIDWQVWNEVNLGYYWGGRPNAKRYLALVRLTRDALKSVNPGARVIGAGLIPFQSRAAETVSGERYLRRLLKLRGAPKAFDALAIHPYGARPEIVLKSLSQIRKVLASLGAGRMPLWVTEFGWATAGKGWKSSPLRATRRQQARWVSRVLRALKKQSKRLRLKRALYFSLKDGGSSPGTDPWASHMGLFDANGEPKPAWFAFARRAGGRP